MRTVGIEIELSDIVTVKAAQIIWESQHSKPFQRELWQDRYGGYSKPKHDWSKDWWRLISDATLRNSDGSRCMSYGIDESGKRVPYNSSKMSSDRYLWKGAELISPPYRVDDFVRLQSDMNRFTKQLVDAGAVMKMGLFDSLHVHVSIEDQTFEQLRSWPRRIFEIQSQLKRLGTGWRDSSYTEEVVERLARVDDQSEWWRQYRFLKGEVRQTNHDGHRRIVDLGPWFNPSKPSTIEWRCFRASVNTSFMWRCVRLATQITESWANNEDVSFDWVRSQVDEILDMYEE